MLLNANKTKVVVVSSDTNVEEQFHVNGFQIQTVTTRYLGIEFNDRWDQSQEIKIRIEKAQTALNRMRKVLCSMKTNLQLRTRTLKCYVFLTLMYGEETWNLTDATCKRLEAFEMLCYRRMLWISWRHHVTNPTVLQRMRKEKEIILNKWQKRSTELDGPE